MMRWLWLVVCITLLSVGPSIAAPESVRVELTSQPSGAEVFSETEQKLTGRYLLGRTPLQVELSKGYSHTLIFKHPGYQDTPAQLKYDQTALFTTLTPVQTSYAWYVVVGVLALTVAGTVVLLLRRPAPEPPPEVPSDRIGAYRLVEKVGEGAFSEVWRATHIENGGTFAVKLLQESDPDMLERFRREVEVGKRLRHPNLVSVYESHFGSRPAIIMEFLPGVTLSERLRSGPLPWDEAIRVFQQIGNGVAYLHAQGIVHRDLKPENIMLQPDGRVRLMDLGVACHPGLQRMTATGTFLGTPQYMSPEQLDSRRVQASADVYSLGAILFEMLAGRPLFTAVSTSEVISAHLYEVPASLKSFKPGVPDSIDDLISNMLLKNPDKRPQSVAEVLSALQGMA